MKNWVLQGNPETHWQEPWKLFTEPINTWSCTGATGIRHGDRAIIWIANRRPRLRGIYAIGKVQGPPYMGYPKDWGTSKQAATLTPFVPLAIYWYVTHHPVSVDELRPSPFGSHQILAMPRRTAYGCSDAEFDAAMALVERHGPTSIPVPPAPPYAVWQDYV